MTTLETLELEDLAHLVEEARELALTPTDELNPEATAGLALELAAVNNVILAALEPLKVKLREIARATLPDGVHAGKVTITGSLAPENDEDTEAAGDVTVTFPERTAKLKSTADPQVLKNLMGAATFDRYFETETRYKPRKTLPALVTARLRAGRSGGAGLLRQVQEETDRVMGAVEYNEPTPRVSFKPDPTLFPG